MSEIDHETVRGNKDYLIANGDKIGGWTTKSDCRQTGCSIHFKFDNKVNIGTTMEFVNIIERSPGMLVNALRLLLGEEQVVEGTETAPVSA